MSDLAIVRAGPERLDDLEPLWTELSRHHAKVAPELTRIGPLRASTDSWRIRRELYEAWLAEPRSFAFLAEHDGRPVGYAVVHLRGPEETWATEQIGVLESLAVLAAERGRGIGSALVARVFEELRQAGIEHFEVAVMASNQDAVRFYERLGLTRFLVTYLGRVPA